MKKNLKKKEKSKFSETLFHFIIPLAILLIIIDFLTWWYYKYQESVFSTSNTLLCIHSNETDFFLICFPCIIMFFIMLSLNGDSCSRIMKIKIFSFIALVIFIISAFILIFQLFEYTNINKEGICIRNGIFSTNKYYDWSDVTYARVSYIKGSKIKIKPIYEIHLKNGIIINACNSRDFYQNIIDVDNLMQNKKIKINRRKIQLSDYNDFKKAFTEDSLETVSEILNK